MNSRPLCPAALTVRDFLAELGLPSWVKTSGSKGFHIAVPLDAKSDFGTVAQFAHTVGRILVKRDPENLTQEFHKVDRGGRILVDTGRNDYSATFAAAYTVRAKAGAPVSAPCTWEEVERCEVAPEEFHICERWPSALPTSATYGLRCSRSRRSLRRATGRLRELSPARTSQWTSGSIGQLNFDDNGLHICVSDRNYV